MAETRLYRVILQIALEVEGDEDTYWPDIEAEIRDRRSWEYDLVRPGWGPGIVSTLVLDDEGCTDDGQDDPLDNVSRGSGRTHSDGSK